ncbi:extracellular solute-binding protein [Streptomyces sp. H10-C2]|uniref:extracellular solute-binding protein n=1 Tax=unclassified Streptomyces TaxID=2593676 RepID=UPI0024B93BB9|nr:MULTISPECIES: extracellular solute-binding protein [unclassified Streptomyces]MDJ0343960.1 extracellular solute-binding protein [Streptomyces sp. PH10-H1]MDJ0373549.1 extracellular solute-binding protein [Streptomyces sp. H10-C2]
MHRRRLLGTAAAGIAAALALTTLSGCGSSAALGGDVTLHMVAADYGTDAATSSKKYWDDLGRAFEAKNPGIKMDIQVVDWDHVDTKVAEMVKAGQAPDIAQIGSYAAYAAKGQLYAADELFPISTQADFIPSLSTAGEMNRTQYGIPFVSSSRMFFYNQTLFDDAGIKEAPKTWSDVRADAVKLKDLGVKMPFGLPLGPEEAQAESLMWMLGNQGSYTDTVGSYTLDSAPNVEAFQWLKSNLVEPGLTGSDPAKMNRRDVFDAFLAGKAGMINGHPTLLKQALAKGIKVKAVQIPGQGGRIAETLGVADWMMAFKQNGHRGEIGKFLQFSYSPENSVKFLDEYGLLPVTNSAMQKMRKDPKYKDLVKFIDLLPSAQFYPVNKTSWGPVSDQMKKVIGNAVHGDPKTVLSDLQRFAENQDASEKVK